MPTIYDEENKLWINPDRHPLDHLKKSMGEWIWRSLAMHGPKIAQINDDTGVQSSFNDVRLRATRAAQNLQNRGYKSRELFCFLAENTDDLLPIYLASIGLACITVPLHSMLTKNEIVPILMKIQPIVIFCDTTSWEQLNAALTEIQSNPKVFIIGDRVDGVESVENLFAETDDECNFVPAVYDMESDIACILCSSGTTGPSKCACLSYGNTGFIPIIYEPNSRILCFHSIYWLVGIKQIIESIYNGATRIITKHSFSPELYFKLVEKYEPTVITTTPFLMVSCLKSDQIRKTNLSSVKHINFYGGKVPNNIVTNIKQHFPNANLLECYGMTEIGVITLSYINDDSSTHNGQLYYDYTAKIIDDDGNRCGPYVSGELCLKNVDKFFGYLNDPVTNAASIDDEGFLRTGDICHFDDMGNLWIEARKKEIVKLFHFYGNLVPSQIEDFLHQVPGIANVCVVGIPIVCGQGLPAAVIVRCSRSTISKCDVFNLVADKFAPRLKLRAGVYFIETLPKTKTGKLRREAITQLATGLFKVALHSDPDIKSFSADISEQLMKFMESNHTNDGMSCTEIATGVEKSGR